MPLGIWDQPPFQTVRPTAALPQTAAESIFRIAGGKIALGTRRRSDDGSPGHDQRDQDSIRLDDTGPQPTSAPLDITGKAAGTLLSIVGVLATALVATTNNLVVPASLIPWPGMVLGSGDIKLNCGGSMVTGAVRSGPHSGFRSTTPATWLTCRTNET
jgi:hypothetical protein